ncbi:MAG: hypothetical protein F6J93_18265 [Oscillatoria sp. SIO1A7]|nr:hypothetical protein [Oscillatoria sp. SIO1A7]
MMATNIEDFELTVLRGRTLQEDWFCDLIPPDIGIFLDIEKIFHNAKKDAFKELCKRKYPSKFYDLRSEHQKTNAANLLDNMGIDFLLWINDADLVAIDLTSTQDNKFAREKLRKMPELLPLIRAIGERVGANLCYGVVVQWIIFSRQADEEIQDWMLEESFCDRAIEEFSSKFRTNLAKSEPCFRIKIHNFGWTDWGDEEE